MAQLAIEYIKYGVHVSEVYSPPRVGQLASKLGLSAGTSFDLTQADPDDGLAWDFNLESKRDKAKKRLREEKPFLLIGCPPCTAFSQLFRSNISRMNPAQVNRIVSEGLTHLKFCMELYHTQVNEGRFFLHEHPLGAWSWTHACVTDLLSRNDVWKVRGDMCRFGMYLKDRQGEALAFKPTGWMSNSWCILEELNKLCTNKQGKEPKHRHVDLQGGVAKHAAVYPEKLCLSILRGLRRELIKQGAMFAGQIGTVCEDTEETLRTAEMEWEVSAQNYFDSVTGQRLDPKLVKEGRQEEKQGVLKQNVFTKRPIQ